MTQDRDSLQSIDHITIPVSELDQTVKWYLTSFNCELLSQEARTATIRFLNVNLVLSLPSAEPSHIAFERLDSAGFGRSEILPDGRRSTYVSDPSGNLVELLTSEEQRSSPND